MDKQIIKPAIQFKRFTAQLACREQVFINVCSVILIFLLTAKKDRKMRVKDWLVTN